ncbi:MAG TPA: HEAT repeat domain-containing protein [Tepidisphaeraceae bacterium]|jgi:HEAT repeat protein|nr:HEAT repeat domain-containing protein [Tepidisphaeraceae bacterium]
MLDRLLNALILSKNLAADDVLLEALRVGSMREQGPVLDALLRRKSVRGLCGVIEQYDKLAEPLQLDVLANIKLFHHALREAGRSENLPLRLAALRLIALGRQGKLAYVLSENLHDSNETLSKAATEAMVALARWVATETKRLQKGLGGEDDCKLQSANCKVETEDEPSASDAPESEIANLQSQIPNSSSPQSDFPQPDLYADLISQRPEIEAAVARALDVHRGKHGQDLLRAALLLCDWPGSKTLAVLHTAKHGGQSPMVRRLQQPPASEHVEAFLLGASHGQLRSHFGIVFSHIDEAPVLDALLRRTHWLKDHQLQLCMHQVTRGAWWGVGELLHDIERRTGKEAALAGEWIAASGIHDVVQDERLEKLLAHAANDFDARLRLLRIAARRKRGASVQFLRTMLSDPDERLVRMAARELVRRRPADYENMLLQLMTAAPPSVRRVVSRAIGQVGFDQFWQRYDRLDRPTRQQAGRAMLKILPDALQRLQRRLGAGAPEQRIKAMQIAQELGLADDLREPLVQLCTDANPRLRSKAVSVLGDVRAVPSDVLVDRLVNDTDPRVRANAIEVMEQRPQAQLLPVLTQRARAMNSRERANAIKALHGMKVGAAGGQLILMLRDTRPEHRISALWALRQIGWWQLINEVGRVAKEDENLRVRRYALGVLKNVVELAREQKGAGAA